MVSFVEVFRHALNQKGTPIKPPGAFRRSSCFKGYFTCCSVSLVPMRDNQCWQRHTPLVARAFVSITPSTIAVLARSFKSAHNELVGGAQRNAGLQASLVGWFYIVGALSQSAPVIAATIVGHGFVLPPLLLLAGVYGNLEPGIAVALAFTDFVFGNLAW